MFVSIMETLNSDLVTYVLLPLFIFLARIIDVSLGTLRIIFVTKGMRKVAPLVTQGGLGGVIFIFFS